MECLTEIFTKHGLFEENLGVLVNRKGIFNIYSDIPMDIIKEYVNFAVRIGTEITGIQKPIIAKENIKNTISFFIDEKLQGDIFNLRVKNEGVILISKDKKSLKKAVEYMNSMFPYLNNGHTLCQLKDALENKMSTKVCITDMEVSIKDYELKNIDITVGSNEKSKIDDALLQDLIIDKEKPTTNNTYKNIKKYLNQSLNKNIVIDELHSDYAESVILMAMRIALDNFEAYYPILSDKIVLGKNNIILEKSLNNENAITIDDNNIILRGRENSYEEVINNFIEKYDELANINENNIVNEIKDILESKNEIGQIIDSLVQSKKKGLNIDEIITKNFSNIICDEKSLEEYVKKETFNTTGLKKHNDGKEIYSSDYEFTWEGTDFINIFKNEALLQINSDDEIEVYGVLSEDLDVRCDLEKQIEGLLRDRGCNCKNIKIYRSLKPGLSWIEETVIPDVLSNINKNNIEKVVIKFNNFANENGEQFFESESTPNYGEYKDSENKWFDLPTRWLQELYPADEIISKSLNVDVDNIIFEKVENQNSTYYIEVYGNNRVIYSDEFTVRYVEKPYMKRYPKIGSVHITTGGITVKKNNEIIVDKNIDTDMQKVWKVIEENELPKIERYFLDKFGKDKMHEMQPLFNRLQIDINTSEVDYDLGIQEERISTIESLQEDLYFYILDYFKTYGERECGKELDNIGLIIPEIKNCKYCDTKVAVKLYEDYAKDACYIINNKSTKIEEDEVELNINKIEFDNANIVLNINISPSDNENIYDKLTVLQDMIMNEEILKFDVDFQYILDFIIGPLKKTIIIKPKNKPINILTEDEKQKIIENEIISYDRYLQLLDYYSHYDELKILPIETTYRGKKIYAIEIVKKDDNIFYSRNKLMLNRITCLFNGRHHGNEASSTNSSFMLIDKIINDESYWDKMDKMNLIILPFENIDGGELHSKMQKDNPKWLFHIARFNSAGYEFRKDYLNPDSKYGEARALPKLWEKWLPDIVTDNHGFESHEFYLQFSGYVSPWYKSFWLPRALYYGYIWYDEAVESMKRFGKKLQKKVTEYINSNKDIKDLNDYWAKRFYKYAEKWHPDMFNTERCDDLIFYWIEKNNRKRICNFALLFPEITTLDWTTEVADETAIGEYLKLNSKAHLVSDLAVLDLIYETKMEYEISVEKSNDKLVYTKIRKKPLN